MTEHPGEEFPPAVDPDVEPQPDERRTPDYDTEPEPDITPYVDQADAVDYTEAPLETEDTEQTFEASLEDDQAFVVDEVEEVEETAPVASAEPFVPKPGPPTMQEQAEEREDGVHPLVEETMERLDGLRERPVSEHAEVYADLHERLQTALVEADAEHGDRG